MVQGWFRSDRSRRPQRRATLSDRRLKRWRSLEMDRHRVLTWAFALGLAGACGTVANAGSITFTSPINFTGNVAADFPGGSSTALNVGSVVSIPGESASSVYQAPWITQSGWTNGWAINGTELP